MSLFIKLGSQVRASPRAPILLPRRSLWQLGQTADRSANRYCKTPSKRWLPARAAMHTNRLAKEESPYLLQHQHNPVDWYPWGEEAFELAKRENKPIFLSVGYSTCHWCHVMERESFESEDIARIMNAHYVNIKVDREERPDVDKQYMTYLQATQGGGGWPMSVFLTPDLQPFLAGTYFPPQDSYGRPGFVTVLQRVAQAWREKGDAIKAQSAESMEQLAKLTEPEPTEGQLPADGPAKALDTCVAQLSSRFDRARGGFGGAPKFPRPSEINVLLRQYLRLVGAGQQEEAKKVLGMATLSLQKMAAGGMYDHVGGGFHRYSVDEFWHVPHFEKMMYDNPQLVQTYLAAFQLTQDAQYAWVARGVLDYMLRDMTSPEGGFYAAEDADSLDVHSGQKKEGEFYVWTQQEIDTLLGPDRSPVFCAHYYVKPGGNCDLSARSDPHHEFVGKNVLIARQAIQDTAALAGKSVEETEQLLAECREVLFAAREKRPRPHRDDKVVSAWNGMAIAALAAASRVLSALEDPPLARRFPVEGRSPKDYLQAAIKAAAFVRSKLYDESSGQLRRCFTRGPSAVFGFADDYALVISGLLELFAATGDVAHLQWARQLQSKMDELFWDEVGVGYFNTAAGDSSILLRMKEDYDGAEPAATSIATDNLWRLAGYSGTQEARELRGRAERCAAAFGGRLGEVALAMPQMCCSLHLLAVGHPRQVIIGGAAGRPDTEAMLDAAQAPFAPDKVIIPVDPQNQEQLDFWRSHNPEAVAVIEATGWEPTDPATAFVCQNFTCKSPTTAPSKLRQILGEPRVERGSRPSVTPVNLPQSKA